MSDDPITIRHLGPEDAHILDRVRPGTFDNPVDPARSWAFLATGVNVMVVALSVGEVIGFASGNVVMHPDKDPSFFVNEVSVHVDFRRRGIARKLMARICDIAQDRRCVGIWLATEAENDAARGLYQALHARETTGIVVYDWDHPDLKG